MRVAVVAGTIATVACIGVAGAVLAQRSSILSFSSMPPPARSHHATASAPPARAPVQQVTQPEQPVVTSISPAPVAVGGSAGVVAAPAAAPADASQPVTVAQGSPPAAAAAAPAPTPAATPSSGTACPGNPNALGISRTVEIDTTGGPGFGFEHFKSYDFLREGEVVLTFDDGPWPKNTPAVLAALAHHCTKAIFFPIGLHATYEPQLLKQVAAAGHAVGSHTWCHQDLSKTKGKCLMNGKLQAYEYNPIDEIEKGVSAVHWAVGGPTAPYFRFPALKQPPQLIEYLGKRNIAIFSADFDSFDFKMRRPEQVLKSVIDKLKKHGKGIVLMHDFQHATAEASETLLDQLKAGGYKIVFMKPKFPVTTIASYDELVLKEIRSAGGGGGSDRPVESVVRTVD